MTLHAEHGYEVVIIGLDGSPSSGVRLTSTKASWGGRPEGAVAGGSDRIAGMGIWMEELKFEFEFRNLPFPRASGIDMDAQTFDMNSAMTEMAEWLSGRESVA